MTRKRLKHLTAGAIAAVFAAVMFVGCGTNPDPTPTASPTGVPDDAGLRPGTGTVQHTEMMEANLRSHYDAIGSGDAEWGILSVIIQNDLQSVTGYAEFANVTVSDREILEIYKIKKTFSNIMSDAEISIYNCAYRILTDEPEKIVMTGGAWFDYENWYRGNISYYILANQNGQLWYLGRHIMSGTEDSIGFENDLRDWPVNGGFVSADGGFQIPPSLVSMDNKELMAYFLNNGGAYAEGAMAEIWIRFTIYPGKIQESIVSLESDDIREVICSNIGRYPDDMFEREAMEWAIFEGYASANNEGSVYDLIDNIHLHYSRASGVALLSGDESAIDGISVQRMSDGRTVTADAAFTQAFLNEITGTDTRCHLYPPHLAAFTLDAAYTITVSYKNGTSDELILPSETAILVRFTGTESSYGDSGYVQIGPRNLISDLVAGLFG